jgi:hypothetical protein
MELTELVCVCSGSFATNPFRMCRSKSAVTPITDKRGYGWIVR